MTVLRTLSMILALGFHPAPADSHQQHHRAELGPLPTLTTTHAAHTLTREQAAKSYPVHLHGVITWYEVWVDSREFAFYISDPSGAVYVHFAYLPVSPLVAGDMVDVIGVSDPGDYAPIVAGRSVRVVGKSRLPANPAITNLTTLITGAQDSQMVEVEGVVHAVSRSRGYVHLELALSDGAITATTVSEPGANYDALVDAKIKLRANAAPRFNHQGQVTGARLVFPNRSQITIETPAPPHPFALPVSPISSLLRFTPTPGLQHRVHLRGTVTLSWPGRLLCLQQGAHGLCAQTGQSTALQVGQLAEVIGFPAIGAFTPTLTHAVYVAVDRQQARSAEPVLVEPIRLARRYSAGKTPGW